MHHLDIELLGPPQISLDGKPVRTDRHKAIALLAFLATEAKAHRREALAALLWPDYPRSSAFAYLRRTLWELNQMLSKGWIETDRESVRLVDKAGLSVDTEAFRQVVVNGSDQPELLAEAAELYRGDFLSGLVVADTPPFEEWQLQQAEFYRGELGRILERLVYAYEMVGKYEPALPYAQRWLALDRLNEAAYRASMRLMTGMGDRSGAIRVYQTCAQTLQRELEVSPEPETEALYQSILRGEKPEQKTIHVEEHPATATSNLPTLTPFIGRGDEIEQVLKLTLEPRIHLLTLTGPGGNGKTRLSIEAARQMAESFPDGVWFIPLAAVGSVEGMVLTVGKGLRFSFYKGDELPQEQLLDFLRQKRLLLVLDNFEHLLDGGRELVMRMLEAAPEIKLLVTSRERINLQIENVYHVSGMKVPDLDLVGGWDNPVEQALEYSSVQLLFERARSVRPDFELTPDNIEAVVQICQLVEGSPLGIELAVTWLELLPPGEVVREISRSLDFLESQAADLPERQHSLRAVFDSSWNRLAADEQQAFRRLCVFRGSFSRQAALEVGGCSLRILLNLANKSWLEQADASRFQLHEVLRQYGMERLQADTQEWQETKDRQAQFYANFTQVQGRALRTADQIQAIRAMKTELESNIPAAWEWLLSTGRFDMLIEMMLPGLFHFWQMNIRADEFIKVLKQARKALSTYTDRKHQLYQAILETVETSLEMGWYIYDDQPKERLVRLWARVEELDLADEMGFWYLILIATYGRDLNYQEVSQHMQEYLQKVNIFQDAWELGYCYLAASLFSELSDLENRKKYLLNALDTFTLAGVVDEQGVVLRSLAELVAFEGDYKQAIEYGLRALPLFEKAEDQLGVEISWLNLSTFYINLGDFDQVFHAMAKARNLHEKNGNRRGVGNVLAEESRAASRYGDLENALSKSLKSLEIAKEVGNQNDIAWHTWETGEVYRLMGNIEQATQYFQQALPMFTKMEELIGLGSFHRGMGDIAMMRGDLQQARKQYEQALVFQEREHRVFRIWGLVILHARLGDVLVQLGGFDEARRHLRTSLSQARNWHNADIKALPLVGVARLLTASGSARQAVEVAACIASKPTTWNETKKQAQAIVEQAKEKVPPEVALLCKERGEKMEIDTILIHYLEEAGELGA